MVFFIGHGTPPQRRSAVRLGFLLADPANVNLTAYNFDKIGRAHV